MVAMGMGQWDRMRRDSVELVEPVFATIDEDARARLCDEEGAMPPVSLTLELDLATSPHEAQSQCSP